MSSATVDGVGAVDRDRQPQQTQPCLRNGSPRATGVKNQLRYLYNRPDAPGTVAPNVSAKSAIMAYPMSSAAGRVKCQAEKSCVIFAGKARSVAPGLRSARREQ